MSKIFYILITSVSEMTKAKRQDSKNFYKVKGGQSK